MMNAKKISTLLLASAGIAMLASCGGSSIKRADAITLLGSMNDAVNADGYAFPTSWKVEKTNKNTAGTIDTTQVNNFKSVSASEVYFTSSFKGKTVYADSNSSNVAATFDVAASAVKKDGKVTMAVKGTISSGEAISEYFTTTAGALTAADVAGDLAWTTVEAAAAKQSSVITAQPASLKKYLSGFGEGTGSSAAYAGATTTVNAYLKAESYSSTGSGNLTANITPVYPKETPSEEPLVYKFDKSRIGYVENDKNGAAKTTYTWDTYAGSEVATSGLTDESADAVAIASIAVVVAGLAAKL